LLTAVLVVLSPVYAYAIPGSMEIDFDGTPVTINYDVEGVEIQSIDPDLDFISLILDVEVTGFPGILEITFDRNFFDSVFEGTDDDFIIIADGDEPDFEETQTSSDSRTLRIELPNGTDEVEIIGTDFGDVSVSEPETAPEPEPEPAPEPEPETAPEPEPETAPEPEVKPKTECGPGTVLKDGVCVLDKKCGAGTVLKDGVCVLDEKCGPGTVLQGEVCVLIQSGSSIDRSSLFDLVYGAAAGFIIAFIVMITLYIIGRASRQGN